MSYMFNCALCGNTLKDAIRTSCGHMFCKKCIDDHTKQIGSKKICPGCKQEFYILDSYTWLNSILDNSFYNCIYCDKMYQRNELENHATVCKADKS